MMTSECAHLYALHKHVLPERDLHEACSEQEHADFAEDPHCTQKPLRPRFSP